MFPITVAIPVAWGDMDAFGHVNNTVYFRWCESARIAYFEACGLNERMRAESVGPILAHASLAFKRPLTFPDSVRAEASAVKTGTTSFTLAYRLWSEKHGLAAEGDSVIVLFDYRRGIKVPLDDALLERIQGIERQSSAGATRPSARATQRTTRSG